MNTEIEIQTFDIATLRMKLRGQQGERPFEGAQRIAGATANLLNDYDAILNALALTRASRKSSLHCRQSQSSSSRSGDT